MINETTAVLLIIGQTVIGPIERQSTENVCTRVMNEIGAIAQTPIDIFGRETPEEKKLINAWKDGDGKLILRWALPNGTRVMCIPAPLGLK